MSRQARWIYRDMLDVYYDKEKPLSLNFDVLCDEIGVESDEDRKIVERLLRFKFSENENGYSHEICERVIAEYHAKASIAKANGKLGGRPPKNNQNKPSGFLSGSDQVPLANPDLTGSQANQEPITNNNKPITKENTKPPAGADLFVGVDAQVVSDFKSMRMQMKAKITKTAIDGIKREALKAGLTLESALRICCERGWRGFKADWITQPARGSPGKPEKFNPTEYVNRNRSDKNERDVNFDAEGNPV